MPRKCQVCEHEQKAEINRGLLEGDTYRKLSILYDISIGALQRHKAHMHVKMTKAQEAIDVAAADSLLSQVKELLSKTNDLLTRAEQAGDLRTALQGVREARGCLELLAKLEGQLAQEGSINIIFAPRWLELRTVILHALEPYPEAKLKLSEALQEVEH